MTNRLLSLDLQGYKTFASSTSFEFPGQITAIVGPNGSGKSNIADAVRWVLGEQAYTLLRGKRTEDMIFSGSQQRPRASMASVSIRFDNGDGWLPVDFSEVVITRRAYRSGENEYLLNNQRVRLKEINELLGNSGLGERNYTIIGQGLIDNALSLKPDERRRFIEEAAGIDLYRSRREEAIKKLDKTLHNMERVQDILGELKPRLQTLSRSKEKTIQFQQIQRDLRVLLKEWYGFQWHQSQKELNEARVFYQKQKLEFEAAKIEIDKKENQLNQIQANLGQNRARLAELHKQVSGNHLEIEEITKNTAVLDERERTLKARISELENEIENTRSQRENYIEELLTLENQAKKTHSDYEVAVKNFNSADELISRKLSEKETIEEELGKIRAECLAGQAQLLEMKSALGNLERDIQQRKTDISEIERFLKRSESELLETTSQMREAEGLLERQNAVQRDKMSQSEQLEGDLKANAENINKLVEEKRKKSGLLSTITAELRVLRDAEEQLEGFSSGSGMLLNAMKEKKIASRLTPIFQHLDIVEKYEQAIAASMGEILEGILLEDEGRPEEILSYLEANRLARTSIFTGRNSSVDAPRLELDANVVYADTVINGDSPATGLIKELLSKTLIVRDRQQAFQLLERIQPGWRLVTMIGEVFEANGIITAGSGSRTQPIRRKREKKHLENEVLTIETELSDLENDLSREISRQTENQRRLEALRAQIKKNQDLIYSKVMGIQKLKLENDQKAKVIQNEKNRMLGFVNEIKSMGAQLSSLKINLEAKTNEIESLQSKIDEESLHQVNHEVEVLRKDMLDLSSAKAVAEELDSRQNESLHFLKSTLKRTDVKVEELRTLLAAQQKTLDETAVSKNGLGSKYDEITGKIGAISQEIAPLEEMVESIIGQQVRIVGDVDESRRQFAIVERHHLQAQMKVEKLQDQQALLNQKITEDFGLLTEDGGPGLYADQPLPLDEVLAHLPVVEVLDNRLEGEINQKKSLMRRLGPVNPEADKEFNEVNERFGFLTEQLKDLEKAESDLRQVVRELDELMKNKFVQTFSKVNEEFKEIFGQLFNGGAARLIIGDEQNVLDGGIEIEATLPGKRRQELALLSGGERSLTAVALIFSLLRISPTPFCILDEVDAMLDESNVVKFGEMLRDLSDSTQFIVITHNRNTVQLADILYGVTMGKDSVSQVISLKMDELTEEMVQ